MAATHGLSTRLSTMEARLDRITTNVDQMQDRLDNMNDALNRTLSVHMAFIDLLERLQPLANYLSPLSNVRPRADSGLGIFDEEFHLAPVPPPLARSKSAPPPLGKYSKSLRRRRGQSNLKREAEKSVMSETDSLSGETMLSDNSSEEMVLSSKSSEKTLLSSESWKRMVLGSEASEKMLSDNSSEKTMLSSKSSEKNWWSSSESWKKMVLGSEASEKMVSDDAPGEMDGDAVIELEEHDGVYSEVIEVRMVVDGNGNIV